MHSKKGAPTIQIGFYKQIIKINISREIKIPETGLNGIYDFLYY